MPSLRRVRKVRSPAKKSARKAHSAHKARSAHKAHSPAKKAHSPAKKAHSPAKKSARKAQSAHKARKAHSPAKKSARKARSAHKARKAHSPAKKSARKAHSPAKKARSPAKKSARKARSYRFGVKVSDGVNTFDAREWQEKALINYFRALRNYSEFGVDPEPDLHVSVEHKGQKYDVFFNRDKNGLYYHPSKTVEEKIVTLKQVPDKSRRTIVTSYDPSTLGQKEPGSH